MSVSGEGGSNGSKRYKARLVTKGFQRKEGVDYTLKSLQ